MMDFNPAELDALGSDIFNIGIFFRMDTDPVVRLWLGFGDIEPGGNVLDPSDGGTFRGFGEIQNIPVYKQLLNGAAERVEFTLSGVSGPLFDLAAEDSDRIDGADIDVGFALMANDWSSLLGSVHWLASYTAGPISQHLQMPSDPSQPEMRTITLSAGSLFTSRKRPGYGYLTDADQQARSPGDLFCSLATQYTRQFNLPWPIYA